MTGRSVMARTASTARRSSWRSEKVSTTKASTPPSSSPSACSRKAALASSGVIDPSGARYFPRGPEGGGRGSRLRGPGPRLERLPDFRRHLVGVEARRVHAQISLGVVRLARLVERLDLLARLAVQHGAIAGSACPLEKRGEIARQPDDRAQGLG